jgi:hypothetical protein
MKSSPLMGEGWVGVTPGEERRLSKRLSANAA